MKYIAHRGNLTGPSPLENSPDYIVKALEKGFECECDVWFENGKWWLGHDTPQYEIDNDFLWKEGLWIHAKNLKALEKLKSTKLNYFWHENDNYTLTSHGYIWAYPGSPISDETICVMPERASYTHDQIRRATGVCSDYVEKYMTQISSFRLPNCECCSLIDKLE